MSPIRLGLLSLAFVATAATRSVSAPAEESAGSNDTTAATAKIDELLARSWSRAGVEPAGQSDDAEFLRRVCLDLGGCIPTVNRVRAFLDDRRPDKRRRVVEELLNSPAYVNHFARVWRALLVPEASASQQSRFLSWPMEDWLRTKLRENTPYDKMVRELIAVPYAPNTSIYGNGGKPSPVAYLVAKELKPENLAAGTARIFLGIKLECAQCHNHPFAAWKRDEFWSLAAFFGGMDRRQGTDPSLAVNEEVDGKQLTIPGTERVVQAVFPDGTQPAWKPKESSRAVLAAWMTKADNPYFTRAVANRMWAHFFGSGLTDPVDEIVGGQNKPSHPELLDELARQFAKNQFDLKFLIRAITSSRAYQFTSVSSHMSQDDPQQFARMAVRGLTADQLFDSLSEATGFREEESAVMARFSIGDRGSVRGSFLTRFASVAEKSTDVQTSILQALTLMNGTLVSDATSLERSGTLAAILDAPFFDTRERVETLYLATLSRKPRPAEESRTRQFLDAALESPDGEGAATKPEREKRYKHALADVLWALLNSGEFYLNH
jgi:hypothetical protein